MRLQVQEALSRTLTWEGWARWPKPAVADETLLVFTKSSTLPARARYWVFAAEPSAFKACR
jgi:hypothetical protein